MIISYFFGHQRKQLPNAAVKTEEARRRTNSQIDQQAHANTHHDRSMARQTDTALSTSESQRRYTIERTRTTQLKRRSSVNENRQNNGRQHSNKPLIRLALLGERRHLHGYLSFVQLFSQATLLCGHLQKQAEGKA